MDKIMLPPWLKYPGLECGSLGWRMGDGEYYLNTYSEWMDTLSKDEIGKYKSLFPEPFIWNDDRPKYGYPPTESYYAHWRKDGRSKYSIAGLRKDFSKGRDIDFLFFWGHTPSKDGSITKSCLSQWWKANFRQTCKDYCCMEQFMMAEKAAIFDDSIHRKIMEMKDPKDMKKAGREVKGFDRELWNQWKYTIVLNGNYEKFMQNVALRDFLIATCDKVLVEASPYDRIWGIGMSEDDPYAKNPLKWKGQNLLGFALMEARDEIQNVCKNYYLGE